MKTEKVLNTLADLVPENSREKVGKAISEYLESTKAELEAEYESKLEEAYKSLATKIEDAEKTGEQGYSEAFEIICDLRDRLEIQKEEFEQHMEQEFEEAYQMLEGEKSKNGNLEVDLYQEYDNRLGEIREYIVDKVDQFLSQKGDEFLEIAKREVLNDPCMAEHKVALDKILEVAAGYISDEDFNFASSAKIEELHKQMEDQKSQMKILEARNMRLHTENTKMNEVARQAQEVLNEGSKIERMSRKNEARNVQSKGQRELEEVKVISEHQKADETVADAEKDPRKKLISEWNTLAGTIKDKN